MSKPTRLVLLGLARIHLEQLNLKDKRRIGWSARSCPSTTSHIRRYVQLLFAAFFHELNSFSPALNYSLNRKLSRLITLIGTIEFPTIN